jgi:hypothetical protein
MRSLRIQVLLLLMAAAANKTEVDVSTDLVFSRAGR